MAPATHQPKATNFSFRAALVASAAFVFVSTASHAQIYRWQDESGKFQYSDKPRPGAKLIKEADKKPKAEGLVSSEDVLLALPNDVEPQKPVDNIEIEQPKLKDEETEAPRAATAQQANTAIENERMSEDDQARLKELSRKHRRCASSRTRMSKLEAQYQQRKLEGAPEQTLDYLQRSVERQKKLVSRDCS